MVRFLLRSILLCGLALAALGADAGPGGCACNDDNNAYEEQRQAPADNLDAAPDSGAPDAGGQ